MPLDAPPCKGSRHKPPILAYDGLGCETYPPRPPDLACHVCGWVMRPHVANRAVLGHYGHKKIYLCQPCWDAWAEADRKRG